MIEREKVIKGLEYHLKELSAGKTCFECPYLGDSPCEIHLITDTIALLKEQEPHVLTIAQLEEALDTVVWLDIPGAENLADGYALIMAYSHKHECMFFDSPFGDNPSQDRLEYSSYGKLWRCWDRRPTEDQRQAVKWE